LSQLSYYSWSGGVSNIKSLQTSYVESIMEYNLLATTEKILMSAASSQLWMNLRAVGDEEARTNKTRIGGLIQGQTNLDPVEAIHLLREHLRLEPDRYDKLFRVLPVIEWVETSMDEIVGEVESQKEQVKPEDTFRVTVEKRRTDLGRLEVIEPVAAVFDNEVDLEEPDWVVLIEIIGGKTGVSIIREEDMLNVQKERAELSLEAD
jgi:tRNA acetyltransferase TAN1